MKNLHKLLSIAAAFVAIAPAGAFADTYAGNGSTGFGGAIGNSTLTVTSDANKIYFSLATSGFNGNGLAIYLDTTAGGFNNTSTFNDTSDNGRTVLSGLSSNGRTLAQFASGFNADYGISVEPGSFAGIFNLVQVNNNTNFQYVDSAGLDTSATTTLNFSVLRSEIGLGATDGFTFVASLISTSAYRSNETIGTSTTVTGPTGGSPNAGFTGTTTFSSFDTYGTPVPEPATWLAGGLLVTGAGWTLSRSRRPVA